MKFFILLILPLSLFAKGFTSFWPEAEKLVSEMTLEEKIGQMTLAEVSMLSGPDGVIDPENIIKYSLGALLVGGNAAPDGKGGLCKDPYEWRSYIEATEKNWKELTSQLMDRSVTVNNTEIPLLLGTDAVHGDQHTLGRVLFPHNIGLAATEDPDLFLEIGYFTARDLLNSGFNWNFAPAVSVAHNYQWGRSYETLGSTYERIGSYAKKYVKGAQQEKLGRIQGALTCTKHFLGDGATYEGIDQGNVRVLDIEGSFDTFEKVNFTPYFKPILEGTGSIMVSYSGINNLPMSVNSHYLYDKLKNGSHPFEGFLVSDYLAVDKVAFQGLPTTTTRMTYQQALVKSINSGIDMIMIGPYAIGYKTIEEFQDIFKEAAVNNLIPMTRIDDAVKRILAVKMKMGLVKNEKNQWVSKRQSQDKPKEGHDWQTALKAAEKSFVLLKNENKLLPLDPQKIKNFIFIGERGIDVRVGDKEYKWELFQDANNIGAQCGGWTLRWQGFEGNRFWEGENKKLSHAMTLIDGMLNFVSTPALIYPHYPSMHDKAAIAKVRRDFIKQLQDLDLNENNTVVIATLSEPPYTEYMGDINCPYCENNDMSTDSGCLYNFHDNAYLPKQQKSTLDIGLDPFSKEVLKTLQDLGHNIPLVTILFSGRPMLVENFNDSDVVIAAWLPGTIGGEALANVIFGKHLFLKDGGNKLPVPWISNMEQLQDFPVYKGRVIPEIKDPLFPVGYGLRTLRR